MICSWNKNELPGFFREQSDDSKNEEHEKHPRMFKVVHMWRVQNSINEELEMGWIQKLNTQINETANNNNIKL